MNGEITEDEALQISLEMRKSAYNRGFGQTDLRSLTFSDPHIKLLPYLAVRRQHTWDSPFPGRYIITCLPGYSSDGQSAFVRFEWGWTPHGAAGTAFLKREKGGWKVLWTKMVTYA